MSPEHEGDVNTRSTVRSPENREPVRNGPANASEKKNGESQREGKVQLRRVSQEEAQSIPIDPDPDDPVSS
ncbi:hypothetical protein EDC30_101386 [Paucimonas lemoignei]|uniref:Uncharacterized protein n=1 Tax=Paucimonas lemoignei TaxID=29443 RepID=A0A4V2UJB3_PAULE|nr:hypothetical protein [Paucimonas lemoignei]TCS39430.1 hypothetical protein EDC30_101386 [Paucimonas lemoignei]